MLLGLLSVPVVLAPFIACVAGRPGLAMCVIAVQGWLSGLAIFRFRVCGSVVFDFCVVRGADSLIFAVRAIVDAVRVVHVAVKWGRWWCVGAPRPRGE